MLVSRTPRALVLRREINNPAYETLAMDGRDPRGSRPLFFAGECNSASQDRYMEEARDSEQARCSQN